MKIKSIILCIFIISTVMSVFPQDAFTDMTESLKKMTEIRFDLLDIAKYSQGNDRSIAMKGVSVVVENSYKIEWIRELIYIINIINNQDDIEKVFSVLLMRIKRVESEIDLSIEEVNLEIAHAQSTGIVSTLNILKQELRRLKDLLYPYLLLLN
ncbi:MAG: hypothetical protein ACOWWR_06400 [Eubacteriales bacterium]